MTNREGIYTGRTLDEAVKIGLTDLGLTRSQVEVEVVQDSQNGFLGLIGNKEARVKINEIIDKEKWAMDLLEGILSYIKTCEITIDVERRKSDHLLNITIDGEDVSNIIGFRGKTLFDLQYLINASINRLPGEELRIQLDAAGYRNTRKISLEELALNLAGKVSKNGKKIELEPMSSYERRVIHSVLKDYSGVRTESVDNEPYRRVVIYCDNRNKRNRVNRSRHN